MLRRVLLWELVLGEIDPVWNLCPCIVCMDAGYTLTNQYYSLCFMVVSVTPAQYFRAKRGIANGIVYAAGGLGGAVISFVMNALLERVGVQWTFRIIGFATWGTGLPAAYLIKQRIPIPPSAVVDWYVLLLHYYHAFCYGILSLLAN